MAILNLYNIHKLIRAFILLPIIFIVFICSLIIYEWIVRGFQYVPVPILLVVLIPAIFILIVFAWYIDIPEFNEDDIKYCRKHKFPPREKRIALSEIKEVKEYSGRLEVITIQGEKYLFPIFERERGFCRDYFQKKDINYIIEK